MLLCMHILWAQGEIVNMLPKKAVFNSPLKPIFEGRRVKLLLAQL